MSIAALVIVAPLVAAILALSLQRRPAALAVAGAAVALVAALVTLRRVVDGERFSATLPGLPDVPLRLVVDPLGALVSLTVAVVSAFVLVYAVGYMAGERDQVRFFAGMGLFVSAMQILVLAGDWILLLAAWELIGVASWLLIGFWFERPGIGGAATRAFLVTRLADAGLYVGIFAVITATGSTAIADAGDLSGVPATVAGLGFLVAVIGKSAQAPLQGWLMDAMVGPSPVSALLHAATLVIAGVVLLTRAVPFLSPGLLLTIGLIGGISSVITGLTAFGQRDLKRLLAASTSSQLGLMLIAIGAGSVPAAVFHLVTHAAMKSSLFLAAGVFQHDRESTAFDRLSGIGRVRRKTFAALVVAGLALAGVPPLAGFWSKDSIIAAAIDSSRAPVLVPLAVAGSALTGVYIGRAIRLLWQPGGAPSGATGVNAHGSRWMGTGLGVLAALAASLGFAATFVDRLLGVPVPESLAATLLGLTAAVLGLLTGWYLSVERLPHSVRQTLLDGFRLDGGLAGLVGRPLLALADRCDQLDRIIHAGVLGIGRLALGFSSVNRSLDGRIHGGVNRVGTASLTTARASRVFDEQGLDGLIADLVHQTRRFSALARRLQTGLVHRELLVAVAGAAVVLLLVLIF